LNCEKENEYLSLSGSPFYINKTSAQWIPQPGKKRLAVVSAFGISGTNAHVVLEEHAVPATHESGMKGGDQDSRTVIVPLSARNEERLREYAERLLAHVKSGVHRRMGELADLSYTLQTGRDAMEYRVAFVVKDVSELVRSLQNFLEGSSDENHFHGRAHQDLAILQTIGSDEDMQETVRRWMHKSKFRNVAGLWVIGADIDWELFRYGGEKRISLPTYPFAKRTCWFHPHKEMMEEIETATVPRVAETQRGAIEAPKLTLRREISLVSPSSHLPALEDEAMLAVGASENGTSHERASSAGLLPSLHSETRESDTGYAETLPTLRLRVEVPPEKPAAETQSGAKSRTNGTGLNLQEIERDLKIHVSEALYLDESEIEIRKKFVDMGLDSIIGVELVNKLNQYYKLNISATRLYDYPNIVELAKFIHETLVDRSGGENISFPEAGPLGVKSLPSLNQANGSSDSVEEQVRGVLKQLSANALTLDDAEQLIANGFSHAHGNGASNGNGNSNGASAGKKDKIIDLISRHAKEIIPELANVPIGPTDSLRDLGANSVDRADILMLTVESLALNVPLAAFHGAQNIGELAELLVQELC
jgi:polyketide synthase PksN